MDIGSRIKKLRKELDLTQTEFATRIGSVQNTVTGYESGRRNPSAPVISLICREFNVNETWLRTGEGDMFLPEAHSEMDALTAKFNMSSLERAFFEKYLKLNQEERERVQTFVKEVYEESLAEQTADQDPSDVSDVPDPESLSIDAEVEDYRRQVELEVSQADASAVSQSGKRKEA